jgi:ribosomal protein S8
MVMRSEFLNLIILNLGHKRKFVTIRVKNNDIDVLKILIKFNIIKYIKELNKKITIFFNYKYNKPVFKIKPIKKSSKRSSISVNVLRKNYLKNKQMLIVSTSSGFLTAHECVKKKTGGIPLINLLLSS